MKYLFTIISVVAFAFASVTLPAQIAGDKIDVTHYEIHLDNLVFDTHTVADAECKVSILAVEETSQLVFELKSLQVDDVQCTQSMVSEYHKDGDFLIINLSTPLQTGTNAVIEISYTGATFNESWGGFHWNGEYAYNLGVGFESIPHNLGKAWFPCVDDFEDKASYDVYLTVPNGKKGISGGLLVESHDNGDMTTTWHWSVAQEIPTYLISFAVGEYELWESVYYGIEADIPITVYVRPSQINKVEGTFVNINQIASSFENWFGPYPFNRIGYISTSLGCMEHVDNIAMSSSLISGNTNNGEETYIAHELSHMWFGDKVTCSSAGDMWLNEGFGTFAGHYYMRDLYGYDAYCDIMRDLIYSITKSCHLAEGWIPLNNMPDDLTYGTTVYEKGATVVHTMMNYLGEDLFHSAMKDYLSQYAYRSASSENLRDAITASTGVDMTHFFENWVFTAGSPHYGIDSTRVLPNGNQYDVHLYMNSKHRGANHIDLSNRYEVAFMNSDWQFVTDTVCWEQQTGHSVKTIDFQPLLVLCDIDEKTADARSDEYKILKETGSYDFSKATFSAIVNEISDSTFLCVEHHWIGPEPILEPIEGLTLSDSRYWSVRRLDVGETNLTGRFQYMRTSAYDQNLIHSQNDSVVLLYRENSASEWHSIPYTLQGIWNVGYIFVDNLLPGDYVLAAWDKEILGLKEFASQVKTMELYPNPAKEEVKVIWKAQANGSIVIRDQQSKIVMTVPFADRNSCTLSLGHLAKGIYFVERCNNEGKIVGIEKLIIE
jgi:Aminopeptidase N